MNRTNLITLLLLVAFLPGCSRSPKSAIEEVLNQCAALAPEVNESNLSASESALYLASQMQAMDTSNCPDDFRVAFQKHINAWRDAAQHFDANTGLNNILESFLGGYLGDPAMVGYSQRQASMAMDRINETYNDLVTIAVTHGARVPGSVIEKGASG